MTYSSRVVVAVIAFLFLFVLSHPAAAAPGRSCGGVGGTIRSQDVIIPQRGGGTLNAKIFAPDASLQTAACPAITMLPGGGAEITSVEWAAARLASAGYVVIVTKPQSGGSLDDYHNAAVSGIDFVTSSANPYLTSTDVSAIGAAGWSLGARVLTRTQEQDTRIAAIVEWDNLATSETGDLGSPQCTNQPATLRTPRVPALGQASDSCIDGRPSDAKKTGFNRWRQFGQPVIQVVFRGANHFWWSGTASSQAHYDIADHYTRNWFDRWLKGDLGATSRLLARSILGGTTVENLFSQAFNSAAFFDGHNCEDIRTACQPALQASVISGRVTRAGGQSIAGARIALNGDHLSAARYAVANPFGYYKFDNVPLYFSYTVAVSAKNRAFTRPSVSLTTSGQVAGLDFVSTE